MSEEAVTKVSEFLKKMGLEYRYMDEEKIFVVPFASEKTGRKFNVLIVVRGDWVTAAAIAARREELPRDVDEKELYKLLLRLTFELSEVTFGLTEHGDIVVHAESHVKALEFENFKVELGSVVFGMEYFTREIMPNYPRIKVPKDLSRLVYLV